MQLEREETKWVFHMQKEPFVDFNELMLLEANYKTHKGTEESNWGLMVSGLLH